MPNGQVLLSNPEFPLSTEGTAVLQLLLLDKEDQVSPGYWMPWAPFHKGSFEVTNTFTGTAKLKTSNAAECPPNIIQLTVGGTPHTGDILRVAIDCSSLYLGQLVATYTVINGDTLDTITAKLITAINAAIALQVNTVNDTQAVNLAASSILVESGGSHLINIQYGYPLPPLTVTLSVTGPSHTTTLVGAPYDNGDGFDVANCSLTAPGVVQFDACGTWIKAYVSAISDGEITAIVQGNIP